MKKNILSATCSHCTSKMYWLQFCKSKMNPQTTVTLLIIGSNKPTKNKFPEHVLFRETKIMGPMDLLTQAHISLSYKSSIKYDAISEELYHCRRLIHQTNWTRMNHQTKWNVKEYKMVAWKHLPISHFCSANLGLVTDEWHYASNWKHDTTISDAKRHAPKLG